MTPVTITLLTLIVYQVLLLGIGWWARQKTQTLRDFFLGGQGLGPWVASLSYGASSSSAWVLIGLSGFMFVNGAIALWVLPGVWMGYVMVWLVIGPALRKAAQQHELITSTDFLALGISGPVGKWIRSLAAIFILICFSFYVASQFQGAGRAFAAAFDLNMTLSVLIGASVVLLYTWFGGFWAVSITDALQAVLMVGASIMLAILALVHLGGPVQLVQAASSSSMPAIAPAVGMGAVGMGAIGFAIGCLGIGLGPAGQPQLLARLMAIRSQKEIRSGFVIALSWSVLVYSSIAVIGLAARVLLAPKTGPETIFFEISQLVLPAILAGIILAAVLSAIMSTADSLLLSAGSAAAHDLGLAKKFVGQELLISRLITLVISLIAIALTLFLPASIFSRVLFAWSALGAAFGPTILLRAIQKPPSAHGVLLSMIVGFTLTIILYIAPNGPGDVYERVIPFVIALLIGLAFRPKN